jgi:hypothetical protein
VDYIHETAQIDINTNSLNYFCERLADEVNSCSADDRDNVAARSRQSLGLSVQGALMLIASEYLIPYILTGYM